MHIHVLHDASCLKGDSWECYQVYTVKESHDKDVNWLLHSQKKYLTPLYIFISVSFEMSLYSWIADWDDDKQWSDLLSYMV